MYYLILIFIEYKIHIIVYFKFLNNILETIQLLGERCDWAWGFYAKQYYLPYRKKFKISIVKQKI